MVVGRGHRHDLRGAGHLLEPDRVGDRARGHDRPLTRHQSRHGGDRADPARVRQRDVGSRQVIGGERVGARLLDQCVVRLEELVERLAAGVADHGNHERPRSVLALDVHGQPQVAGPIVDPEWLTVAVLEVVGHHRHLVADHAGDGVGDGCCLNEINEIVVEGR